MKRRLIAAIRWYQRRLSPGLPPSCRFQPTCSHYAIDAIEARGVVRGTCMAIWRVLRCNPLNDGGLDPVAPPSSRPRAGA